MRVALLTEGGYPFASGESLVWSDRLMRGLEGHDFAVYALSRSERQEQTGWCPLPENVSQVRTAPLWGPVPPEVGRPVHGRVRYGRRERRRFADCYAELAAAICSVRPPPGTDGPPGSPPRGRERDDTWRPSALAERFANGLYGLAELALETGGLPQALRSERALHLLETTCRTPGVPHPVHAARVSDLLAVAERLERALRPLSLDWYEEDGLGSADICHTVGAGPAALGALLAKRRYGTPVLLTEYGVRLREHYLVSAASARAPRSARAPVRALLGAFQRLLAQEAYAQAQLITPGTGHARRWQRQAGAARERLRTVYPGVAPQSFAALGERTDSGRPGAEPAEPTLVWVGRFEPDRDLATLLYAFAELRLEHPEARLRLVGTSPFPGPEQRRYRAHLRELAAMLLGPAASPTTAGGVTFEEVGQGEARTLADAYAAGSVFVHPGASEDFPVSLVRAMFCGRAVVATDVGAVREVVGGTALLAPPGDPHALAEHCAALLRHPARRARLGAAARTRALELFTVERNLGTFHGIYLELMSHSPVRRDDPASRQAHPGALPFARPAESHLPGRWAGPGRAAATSAAAMSGHRPTPAAARDGQCRAALAALSHRAGHGASPSAPHGLEEA
ncbi:DUF3492 domain-containing protein [Streptomyces sp. NPDC005438]|uniref:DUF3492 domain-containing protein n=1 Tax=Streptomyces sp. NPDC005438 TaxID=3156880 RepID=UPI00339EB8E6